MLQAQVARGLNGGMGAVTGGVELEQVVAQMPAAGVAPRPATRYPVRGDEALRTFNRIGTAGEATRGQLGRLQAVGTGAPACRGLHMVPNMDFSPAAMVLAMPSAVAVSSASS